MGPSARWGITDADITWFVTLWTLSSAVCIPVLAKLGDIFGHRKMLRLAVIAVLVGVCFVAYSNNYSLVLVGRILTGPLSVWLPLEIALVHDRIAGERARKSVGLLISFMTVGVVAGMLVSGVIAGLERNFTMVLLVPAIITALCVFVVFLLVPESTVRSKSTVDYLGFLGLAASMITLLLALSGIQKYGISSPQVLVPLLTCGVITVAWVWWESQTACPAIDLRLVRSRLMWPPYLTAFLFGIVTLGSQTVITTFLAAKPKVVGFGFAMAPGNISLLTAGDTLTACVAAATFAYLARAIGMRGVLLVGVTFLATANLLLIFANDQMSLVVLSLIFIGTGSGLLLGALPSLVAELSPADQTGIASGIYNSLKTLGGAVGGAIFGVIMASTVISGSGAALSSYKMVWIIGVAALCLCVVSLLFMRQQKPPANAIAITEYPEVKRPDSESVH
ncbi:MFS transporter [Paenarthrobacter sp. PH39-S1]|uniref:MFS transporter n=1 Tax=Paenarthrobacter sp. PH39-S1 TaxID=3046204 RepID=UPI0024BA675B|nr:MFS transporter [Paenarthrobacter sp. PH39-S1]MDJ0357855.1 MFS transporter [Paenarthrobacter sp. PH39-S1]